jgi:hypothetical protein
MWFLITAVLGLPGQLLRAVMELRLAVALIRSGGISAHKVLIRQAARGFVCLFLFSIKRVAEVD